MRADGGETVSDGPRTLVLHVDDDPQVGGLVETYLEGLDGDVVVRSASSARDGLDRLDAEAVDCVVSDYQMPGMDGLEFLAAVRERYPNLPFILFTGRGSESVASDAINAGVTTYLQKAGAESFELLVNQVDNAVSRRRSEQRAQVARDRLIELYEQTDGFYTIDEGWTITYWNEKIADRTGLPPEETIGRAFWTVFPAAAGTAVFDHLHTAMEDREPVEFETYYDPYDYWTEIRAYPVDEGLFVHSREITEEKEQERELARRNHILESFANTVSHDLRNPLNVAEGRLQLAQETGDFEHLEEVAQAHNRMRNLIDELLRVARGDELSLTTVSLAAAADEAWETVSTEGMTLRTVDDVDFEAHETQLRRLFENLFWNALDHGEAETVRVGALGDDGFYVEDDGVGIPPAGRARVFESGFTTTDEGPGYGLSIVDGIVETHEWEIRVTDGPEGGARFEIRGVTVVAD